MGRLSHPRGERREPTVHAPRPSRVRTLLARGLLIPSVVAGLGAAFLVGTTYGSDPGAPPRSAPGSDASPAAYAAHGLSLPDDCDALLASYVARGVDLVGPYGWGGWFAYSPMAVDDLGVRGTVPMAAGAESAASAPSTSRATNGETGTNVQEAGVDEPDVVKTDGARVYRVQGDDLVVYDATGPEVVRLGSVDLPGRGDGTELLLSGTTVVAIGQHSDQDGDTTEVSSLDVSDPAAPVVTHTASYDARLVTARMHEGVVRLVLQAGLPDLAFTTPDDRTTEHEATQANEQAVRGSEIEDWLPTVTYDGGSTEPLLGCGDVAVPDDDSPLGTLAVVGFDANAPQAPSTSGLAADTELVYASTDQLFVATTPWSAWPIECIDCLEPRRFPLPGPIPDLTLPGWLGGGSPRTTTPVEAPDETTVYGFDLDGLDTTFAAAGTVDGTLRDRWSMDAVDGTLRLAVGTGQDNAVVTLRQDGDDLVEAGRLDGLGVGEQIQSVRWFDDLAIVVTFRQTDPLYAVSLTDPSDPQLLGQLKIPGFSAYLHPLGERRLLGLGEGPGQAGDWGAQAALFDVTDLTDPTRLDVVSYGTSTQALATQDPRLLTWLPDGRTVLTVVDDWSGRSGHTYVSALTVGDGTLDNRMIDVPTDNSYGVRLVPLTDGRVALVTDQDVSFLAL